jgi:glycerophosphoryl diester phosphodiesterase
MMHAAGIRVFPYNADTADEIRRMFDMGVDGVISSDPLLTRSGNFINCGAG